MPVTILCTSKHVRKETVQVLGWITIMTIGFTPLIHFAIYPSGWVCRQTESVKSFLLGKQSLSVCKICHTIFVFCMSILVHQNDAREQTLFQRVVETSLSLHGLGYNNLSSLFGVDRKICPEDHCLAS